MTEDNRSKLEVELEAVERRLRGAVDFVNDDSNLTDKGVAVRETLLREIAEIVQDLEAVRQEHGWG